MASSKKLFQFTKLRAPVIKAGSLVSAVLLSANILADPIQPPNSNIKLNQDPALQMALFSALAKDSSQDYHFDGDSGCANNPAQGFKACFTASGAQIASQEMNLSLHAIAFGRLQNTDPLHPAQPEFEGNEVRYHHGTLTEWYRNLNLGLEQGFTIKAPPKGEGQIQLTLKSNIKPKALNENAYRLGNIIYKDLLVVDSKGMSLPSKLIAMGENLSILIDDQNATYPITIDPWFQQAKLTPNDGVLDDQFTRALAISGNTAIIGAPGSDISGRENQGSAYVFVKEGNSWSQQSKLIASDGQADDLFGSSVDIYGDTVVIGAKEADIEGNSDQGSAYIFVRQNNTWSQQAKLTGNDSTFVDNFGASVALFNDTVIIGAPNNNGFKGAAYIFTKSGTAWIEQAKLTADAESSTIQFGIAVDLTQNSAIIGATSASFGENQLGAAFIFAKNDNAWTQEAKLSANDGTRDDLFGAKVSLFGNTALVSAPLHKQTNSESGAEGEGAAYVFVGNNGSWSQQAKLSAEDGAPGARFGSSVSLHGNTALIGASRATLNDNDQQGAAYLFIRNSENQWIQKSKLSAEDGTSFDHFGMAVGLSGSTLFVGADEADFGVGAAYVFSRMPYYSVKEQTLDLPVLFLEEGNGAIRETPWRAVLRLKSTSPTIILEVTELEKLDPPETMENSSTVYMIEDRILNLPKFSLFDINGNVQETPWSASLKLISSAPIQLEVIKAGPLSE